MDDKKIRLFKSPQKESPDTATQNAVNDAATALYKRQDQRWTRMSVATAIAAGVFGVASNFLPSPIRLSLVLPFSPMLWWSIRNQLKAQHMWYMHASLVSVFFTSATDDQKNVIMMAVKRATEKRVTFERFIEKIPVRSPPKEKAAA